MADLAPLHDEGVFGFKCFLPPSGVDEFPCLEPEELEPAMRETGRLGALRIVHAEHGLYVLEGEAVCLLNKDWVEVQAAPTCRPTATS